ncbi:vitamin B12-dependent ribonucleotide reductase [Candidatus Woesearchaeota archaeon]|nr:vitamin B12-dependent ribonucleotide reductase [Candidatus Woesearchaeota archaeon]
MVATRFSPMILDSYDKERLIPYDDALTLVRAEPHLSLERLTTAVAGGDVHAYEFKGTRYVDRLDIGRVFHDAPETKQGLSVKRFFSDGKTSPYDSAGPYQRKQLELKNKEGQVIFQMDDAEFPQSWDENNATVVSKLYFYKPNAPEQKEKLREKIGNDHEYSLKHLVARVTNFFADEGWKLGYFKTEEDRDNFRDELAYLQMNRMFAFNTPVQINAGLYNEYGVEGSSKKVHWRNPATGQVELIDREFVRPQTHACFIKGPRDNLDSILEHFHDEGAIFSNGSGIGQNIGVLRAAGEPLSGGGTSSGALSFLKEFDRNAGSIKSGGKSRRAARMTEMRQDHPDVMEFIRGKPDEDHKALTLIQNGWSAGMDGDAYGTVAYQNTNLSVQLNDEFFERLKAGGDIDFHRVVDGKVVGKISADRMLKEIAFGSWRIGDPAVQYEGEIQRMHTAKNSGRINSTNPCSEYVFLDDTSCNLASLNLLAFSDTKGNFDVGKFTRASRLVAIAQDIANDAAGYPIDDIATISPEFRTIGLGYANLGALLMRRGVAYDSLEGRAFAGAVTAVMTGTAYETSAEMAEGLGTFIHYELNKRHMAEVIDTHKERLKEVQWEHVPTDLKSAAEKSWGNAVRLGKRHGYRNAQATVLAPTGTISSLMGCDSTGVEPVISHVIYKDLAGGGVLTLVNKETANALANLGYTPSHVKEISDYMTEEIGPKVPRGTVLGAPHMKVEHYPIFDTAFGNKAGEGSIAFEGHVRMLGATQPFISGAISKTNNLPESATVRDIYEGYLLGHELKLKAIAVFRNNSKPALVLNFGERSHKVLGRGEKEELPTRRRAFEWELRIGDTPLHIMTSEYEDGRPGQIVFLSYKAGSTLGANLQTAGVSASKALKRGVDLEDVLEAWDGQEFKPQGLVQGHPWIKTAASPLDLAAKILRLEYLGQTEVADNQEGLELGKLHGADNGAFRTYARKDVDEWNFDSVMKDSETGGFVEATGLLAAVKKSGKGRTLSNSRGLSCTACGNPMDQTAPNCYTCSNAGCRNKIGGCGM